MKKCISCEELIPKARLKALPHTKECVQCSSEERNMVRSVITGKNTYSEVEVIKSKEGKQNMSRIEGRGRVGYGSMLYRAKGSQLDVTSYLTVNREPRYYRYEATADDLKQIHKKIDDNFNLFFSHDIDKATQKSLKYIRECLDSRVINSVQYHKLKKMINLVHNANAVTS